MFEIIMLFAFLYAATCQLFPERSATKESRRSKEGLLSSEKRVMHQSAKAISRSHSYVCAA